MSERPLPKSSAFDVKLILRLGADPANELLWIADQAGCSPTHVSRILNAAGLGRKSGPQRPDRETPVTAYLRKKKLEEVLK